MLRHLRRPTLYVGARGRGTMLQAGRSWVRFSMRSLDFLFYIILPAALWTQPRQKWVSGIFLGGKGRRRIRLTTSTPRRLTTLWASMVCYRYSFIFYLYVICNIFVYTISYFYENLVQFNVIGMWSWCCNYSAQGKIKFALRHLLSITKSKIRRIISEMKHADRQDGPPIMHLFMHLVQRTHKALKVLNTKR
jgi:hypothetical protein